MMANDKSQSKREIQYPFIYFGHGTSYARKALACCLFFRDRIPVKAHEKIEKMIPSPFNSFFEWGEQSLFFTSDEAYLERTEKMFHATSNHKQSSWDIFEEKLEKQMVTLNQYYPLQIFYKPSNPFYGGEFSQWHTWSVENFEKKIIPFLGLFFEKHGERDKNMASWVFEGFLNEYLSQKTNLSPSFIIKAVKILAKNLDQEGIKQSREITKTIPYELLLKARSIDRLLSNLSVAEQRKVFSGLSAHSQLYCCMDNRQLLFIKKRELDISKIRMIMLDLQQKFPFLVANFFSEILALSEPIKDSSELELLNLVEKYIDQGGVLNESLLANTLFQCQKLLSLKKDNVGGLKNLIAKMKR